MPQTSTSEGGNINIQERMKVPLAILKANGGKLNGKTKLQKLVFLAEMEKGLENKYKFEKYNYGPYSFELTDDLDALKQFGLIEVIVENFSTDDFQGKIHKYKLTKKGEKALNNLSNDFLDPINKVSNEWGSESLDEILDYVYGKYMDE